MDIAFTQGTVTFYLIYTLILIVIFHPNTHCKNHSEAAARFLTYCLIFISCAYTQLNYSIASLLILLVSITQNCHVPQKITQSLAWLIIIPMSFLLSLHITPGIHNDLILDNVLLGNATIPYSLSANFDKSFACLIILLACYPKIRHSSFNFFVHKELPYILLIGCVIFSLATVFGAEVDIKLDKLTLAFAFFNLLVTCVAEESFFRLVIQEGLRARLTFKYKNEAAALVSALLFTLAHFHTGDGALERLTLTLLAGLLYAFVYARNRSLISAIAAHSSINLIHFSFFTYPF